MSHDGVNAISEAFTPLQYNPVSFCVSACLPAFLCVCVTLAACVHSQFLYLSSFVSTRNLTKMILNSVALHDE